MNRSFAPFALFLLLACGDDDPASDDAAGAGASSSSAATNGSGGAGAEPGVGGSGAQGGGAAGVGGSGGGEIDPIAGIAAVELVVSGFEFTEGPAWFAAEGHLLFTDIPASAIHQLVPPAVLATPYPQSGESNGLGVDPAGMLIACEHANRRVVRRTVSSSEVLADAWDGMQLNSPNDNIVRSDGTIYFTDPPYGISANEQELPFQGVFRIAPDGTISLIDDTMNRPNGIALSPDETTLYVADSADGLVRSWAVAADGSTGQGDKLMDTSGSADGMAIDDQGNLYVTTSAGVEVYRADGSLRGTIVVPEQPANCTFGGADRRTLYITARTSLYSVVLNLPGKP
jgi:gluconolactonase